MTKANECTCPSGDGSLRHPCPAHPALVEQAGGDERAAFRPAQVISYRPGVGEVTIYVAGRIPGYMNIGDTVYVSDRAPVEQPSAALAQPSPAQDEQAEAERPELWAVHAQGPDELYAAFTREDAEKHAAELNALPMPEGIAVGAVVAPSPWPEAEHWKYLAEQERDHKNEIAVRLRQFERICEGLPQDAIDGGWTVQGIRAHSKQLEEQLKSALARVAELTATRNRYGVDAHYFNKNLQRILRNFESFTPDELARSLIILAKVADEKVVAQAQHSVPEEFSFEYRHPNGECHTVTVSREQVINEMPDFLFEALCSKFCNCEPVGETNVVECCCDEYAEEFKLIAAAPGKEVGHE
ncbi:hypothetical protein ACM7QQ_29250 [Pseudomonas aeruginosa]